MNVFSLEAAIYDISTNKAARTAFRDDPEAALAGRRLGPGECAALLEMDLARLLTAGVNPMLLQGFWAATRGPATLGEFVNRVNALGRPTEPNHG